MGHGKSLSGEFVFITSEKAAELGNANLKPGDLVFPHRGAIGEVGIVPDDGRRYALSTSLMKITLDCRRAIPDFYYYFFKSTKGQSELLKNASQVGTPGIATPLKSLRECVVTSPSLSEQASVVAVLRCLDDRIDLLRQTNTTLEAIAQALFKSWFVDFDPVHAKAEGREPEAMDTATAALFPSEFEKSELGLIPQGWRVVTLREALEINPRRTLRKGTLAPYLDMASVPISGHVPTSPIEREFSSGTKFQNGDTLLARITPCLENGKTAHVDFLEADQVGWGSTEFIVLRPRPPLTPYFAYLLARQPEFRAFAIQAMTGTSGRQRIELGQLERFHLTIPDDRVAAAFGSFIEPMRKAIAANAERMVVLAQLRDTLLPRLISGKLRLPKAESPDNRAKV